MAKGKKPAAPANSNDDFADILGDATPGPLPGSDNMPDVPIEAPAPELPDPSGPPPVVGKVEDAEQIKGYEVAVEFRDINNFSYTHRVGADVSHLDNARLEKLLTLGYVKEI